MNVSCNFNHLKIDNLCVTYEAITLKEQKIIQLTRALTTHLAECKFSDLFFFLTFIPNSGIVNDIRNLSLKLYCKPFYGIMETC